MSRLIANLLDVSEPLFALEIEQLERATGRAGVDVRLTADIIANLHHCLKSLGLDPHDSTGPELYGALQTLVSLHDSFLMRRLGAEQKTQTPALLNQVTDFTNGLNIAKTAWFIRYSAAKRLLKVQPPKHVMRQLGHRSIDSMLRREPMPEVLAAIRFAEKPSWQQEFVKKYKELSARDFEERDVEIINLTAERWGKLAGEFVVTHRHNLINSKEYGVIALLPLPVKYLPGLTLAILPRIFHCINEIRLYSAYFRFCQIQPNFGTIVRDTLLHDRGSHAKMADYDIHWRIIQRHFGRDNSNHPELFEPYLRREDLAWQSVEATLRQIEPAFQFWQNLAYVGAIHDGHVISCNLFDNANAYVGGRGYHEQPLRHLRLFLHQELQARYLAHPTLEHEVLMQLTTSSNQIMQEINFNG